MKLVIQIPCFNEEETLPQTLADLPRELPGVNEILWLVVDDGSEDATLAVAQEHGVDAVVRLRRNNGLANAFQAGLDAALKLGADIVVYTNADNQYAGGDIGRLIAPILAGEADFVVGDRQVAGHPEFSGTKKRLQALGSWVVRKASGTDIPDTTSGFCAYRPSQRFRADVKACCSTPLFNPRETCRRDPPTGIGRKPCWSSAQEHAGTPSGRGGRCDRTRRSRTGA